jgi:hypothetical protein
MHASARTSMIALAIAGSAAVAEAARLNVEARYLPGSAFRKMFDADSVANADAVKRANLAAGR